MTVRSLAAFLLFAAGLACAPASRAQDDVERIRLHGSNLLGDQLVPSLVQSWLRAIGYESVHRRELGTTRTEISASRDGVPLVVEIDKRGTASGMKDIVEGNAEICMSSRPPSAREMDDAWQLGDLRSPDQEWVLGLHGIVLLVSPGNPVSALSLAQLDDVVSGRVTNWAQLGGPAGPIRLHALATRSGSGELLSRLLPGGAGPARTIVHGSYAEVVAAVAGDPLAIGFVSLRAPRGLAKSLGIRMAQGTVFPDPLSVASEDYPLVQRVYFHTGQLITALGRSFALWVVSPAGQAVVARSQFIALVQSPLPVPDMAQAPEDYRGFVAASRRLPMTVRFGAGLDLLDSRSRQDLQRLVGFLQRPENRGRRVLLMGFANPDPGSPYAALSLSQERADYVSSELLAANLKVVTVRGFGGKRPLADARQPLARWRNERVEVWLR